MVANEVTTYNATNISFLVTKTSGFITAIATSFLYVVDQWRLYLSIWFPCRKPYWKIFASKTLNMRQEVNPSFCFAVLILSHRKTFKWPWPCLKSPYNALQTLGHWLRHVCFCIVLLTCKGPSYLTSILVSGDTFTFGEYFLPIIIYWPYS